MDDTESTDAELHEAVNAALDDLALALGGTSESGGPVENATQIKGRGELGVLLTDRDDRVLGRVWIEFGAVAEAADLSGVTAQTASLGLHASVRSEAVEPPLSLEDWVRGR